MTHHDTDFAVVSWLSTIMSGQQAVRLPSRCTPLPLASRAAVGGFVGDSSGMADTPDKVY